MVLSQLGSRRSRSRCLCMGLACIAYTIASGDGLYPQADTTKEQDSLAETWPLTTSMPVDNAAAERDHCSSPAYGFASGMLLLSSEGGQVCTRCGSRGSRGQLTTSGDVLKASTRHSKSHRWPPLLLTR